MSYCEDELPPQLRKELSFVPFSYESYYKQLEREKTNILIKELERRQKFKEARLKDGELKFGIYHDIDKKPDVNPDLEDGQWLKDEYGKPPSYYMGLPLEEIDPGIEEKTFIVITRRLHLYHISRFSADSAVFCLSSWNPFRRLAVYVCTNQIFDFFILFTIFVNCICLAIPRLSDLDWLELVFFGIYFAEMVVKVLARGFIYSKYTYLHDPWNWLDFVVIFSGILSLSVSAETETKTEVTQALRTFRVLRALKTISIFPGLRTIVNAMLRAIKMLLEVVLMTIFCLLVFSLVSVQIYRGSMRQKCVKDPKVLNFKRETHEPYAVFYRRMLHDKNNWALDQNGKYVLCGNATGAGRCNGDYICQPNIGENPNNGFMNFDNIFWSAIITFQLMTIDFWENAYRKVLLTNGSVTVIFFVMVVFFGSFYLLNLMLAVVTITYQEEAERTSKELENEDLSKTQRKHAIATFYSMTTLATKQNMWAKIINENKTREQTKTTEYPLDKITRMRMIIQQWKKWKKSATRNDMVVNPECIPYFQDYASDNRTGLVVAQNVLYSSKKWRQYVTHKRREHRSSRSFDVPIPTHSGATQSDSSSTSTTPLRRQGEPNLSGSGSSSQNEDSSTTVTAPLTKSYHPTSLKQDITTYGRMQLPESLSPPAKKDSLTQRKNISQGRHVRITSVQVDSADPNENSNINADVEEMAMEDTGFTSTPTSRFIQPSSFTSSQAAERFKQSVVKIQLTATSEHRSVGGVSFASLVSKTMSQRQTKSSPASTHRNLYLNVKSRCWKCCPSVWSFLDRLCTRFRQMLHTLVTDIFFDLFINFVIVANTIVMSSEHHGMSDHTKNIIHSGSVFFTAIFAVEAILKIAGLGVRGYFASSWNRFDFLVAVGSVIGNYLETGGFQRSEFRKATFLKAFRLLRILKLAQVWPAMNSLLTIIGSAMSALSQLTFILLIILYIFAIIGLNLFQEKYSPVNFPSGVPRWNFTDFFHSFMLMFRVLCGEWIEPLWDCMKITEVHSGLCMMVFLPTLIFGNFVVLNLFLALLLNAFGDAGSSKKDDTYKRRMSEGKERFVAKVRWLIRCCGRRQVTNKVNVLIHTPMYLETEPEDAGESESNPSSFSTSETFTTATLPFMPKHMTDNVKEKNNQASTVSVQSDVDSSTESLPTQYPSKQNFSDDSCAPREIHRRNFQVVLGVKRSVALKSINRQEPPSCFPNCILFHFFNTRRSFNKSRYGIKWIEFRTSIIKKIDNYVFEYFVLFFIIASSFVVAIEDYDFLLSPPGDWLRETVGIANVIFMIVFTVEMLLRWVAFGITRYFTSAWTIIDFIVVIVTTLSVLEYNGLNIHNFRAVLALRALKPLQVVSRIAGMKIVVDSLMCAIPAIFNVFLVSLVFWLIFSVMGVQFYAGKFYKCIDLHTKRKVNVTGKDECLKNPKYTWFNSHINFDHIFNGFLALFQVATFEGWMEIMRDAVDSTEVDKQPQKEASFSSYLYFVAFVICGSFVSLNLVIGVIIDNFTILKKKYEGSFLDAFLTLNQRNYYNTLKKLSSRKPQKIIVPPQHRFQKVFYEMSVSDRFELMLTGVVLLNMVAVCIEYYQYTQKCLWLEVMFTAEIAFSTFFALEAVLKIVGLRQHYFTLPWNVYDFVVAFLSVVNVTIRMSNLLYSQEAKGYFSHHGEFFSPTFLRLLRIFRISRALRIVKVAKGLRKVVYSLVISLPAIVNIMALLALFIFVYAVLGIFLFPNVKLTGVLTTQMNFRSFLNSCIMLLCLTTAAGWNDVLDALLIQPPFCNNTHHQLANGTWLAHTNGDCGHWFAIPYLVSYVIITYLFVINLYIAVILENYQQAHQQEETGVTEDDFDMFYTVWQRYDPYATQFIPYAMLSDFVADLDAPLGIAKPNEIALVSINLPILECDMVHCLDILLALVKNVLADIEESEGMDHIKRQINEKFLARFPNRAKMSTVSSTIMRKKEDVAARTLQRAWQSYKTQQAIYSIMTLSVNDKLKGCTKAPRTCSSVKELVHNMRSSSRLFMRLLNSRKPSTHTSSIVSPDIDSLKYGTPVSTGHLA